MSRSKFVALLFAFMFPLDANVLYQFSAPSAGLAFEAVKPAFVLTSDPLFQCPDPVHCVSTADVVPGTCISCVPQTFGGQQFVGLLDANDNISVFHGDILVFYGPGPPNYFFPVGAFSAPGTYLSNFEPNNIATLIVSTDTPEPRTALLLALLFGASLVLRCERQQANKQRI